MQDGDGTSADEKRRAFSRTSYDEHLLTVVGAHLVRSIQHAESVLGEPLFDHPATKALPLLRNLYEHWNEQRAAFADPAAPKVRSGKEFVELFPEGRPWSVTYTGQDFILGGVVPIHALTLELDVVERRVLGLEERYRNEHRETAGGGAA